jgi:tetratricopeptide (TPR) repeat protein
VKPLAGRTFGIVGALEAFPRRLAAREVERLGGQLRRGVGRGTTDVVFGRRLLAERDGAAIELRRVAEGDAGRRLVGEGGFLRLLGLAAVAGPADIGRAALAEQSGLAARDLEMLALFDAFEHEREPFSFRDVILARKYAGLVAGGADWASIARSVHRFGPVASLTAKALHVEDGLGICVRAGDRVSELDGQLRFDLGPGPDLDALFEAAEAAEAAGEPAAAARLYQRCLDADPGDAVAAFNRGNCLRALGRLGPAAQDYVRAAKLDPSFVEAWFNLGGLMAEAGHVAAARRHLCRAIALDAGYADAVFNLASLEFDAGNFAEAGRWWQRYLELDSDSEWARTAARGVRFVALQASLAG